MITAIREVRRARGWTLDDVARACLPPTTAQTIGRLEMGTRTVSVDWLNRIARALEVEASDLVRLPDRTDLPVVAILGAGCVHAPRAPATVAPPRAGPGWVAITVTAGIGEYRSGDVLWCETIAPPAFGSAMNRDILVPRPAGRFLFGRLIGREDGKLHLLPPGSGARQQVIADPVWIAPAIKLVRCL